MTFPENVSTAIMSVYVSSPPELLGWPSEFNVILNEQNKLLKYDDGEGFMQMRPKKHMAVCAKPFAPRSTINYLVPTLR